MKKWICSLLVMVISIAASHKAQAIQGGVSALGSKSVLTLATSKSVREPFCSMALLTEDVVVTAAHCLAKENTSDGSLRFSLENLWVTFPGSDTRNDDLDSRVKVMAIQLYPGYSSFYDPKNNDLRSQEDDIALLLLQRPILEGYRVEIASAKDVQTLLNLKSPIKIYGYGLQKSNKLDLWSKQDGTPYYVSLLPRSLSGNKRMQVVETSDKAMCPGDSGGPWYADFDGETKIVAVNMTGSGCETNPPGQYYADGTLIYPYQAFIESTLEKFESIRFKAKAEAEAKLKAEAEAKAKAEAEAEAKAKAEAEAKAKAKAEAEAKAKAKAEVSKKKTITCVKGKLTKKVTAINPKCPKGYKKK